MGALLFVRASSALVGEVRVRCIPWVGTINTPALAIFEWQGERGCKSASCETISPPPLHRINPSLQTSGLQSVGRRLEMDGNKHELLFWVPSQPLYPNCLWTIVFVRELISNASDALEKLRHMTLTGENLEEGTSSRPLEIHIATDKQHRILTIQVHLAQDTHDTGTSGTGYSRYRYIWHRILTIQVHLARDTHDTGTSSTGYSQYRYIWHWILTIQVHLALDTHDTGTSSTGYSRYQDTGVGMTKEELVDNLGTIARSGSKAFLEQLKGQSGSSEASSIIGQFGVGFYSSFMVADRVEVFTKSSSPGALGYKWTSDGTGSYEIQEAEGVSPGTKIVLHLKPESREFSDEDTIRGVIKKYSNFVGCPIFLNGQRANVIQVRLVHASVVRGTGKLRQIATLTGFNNITSTSLALVAAWFKALFESRSGSTEGGFPLYLHALWLMDPKEVTPQMHDEFYRFVGNTFDKPRFTLHYRTDAPLTLRALLYFPEGKPVVSNINGDKVCEEKTARETKKEIGGADNSKCESEGKRINEGKRGRKKEGGLFEMNRESDAGVALYSRKVLIKSKTDNILPKWLRFVKGVVDSEDIPLNLSRELLQNSALIRKLQTVLTNRLLRFLHDKSTKEQEQFDLFYKDYSPFLKEGIVMSQEQLEKNFPCPLNLCEKQYKKCRGEGRYKLETGRTYAFMGPLTNGTSARTRSNSPSGPVFQEEIAKLLRFESSRCSPGEKVSLPQYIGRLAEGQKDVFYLAAPSRALAEASPYYEALRRKDVEVLFCSEPYDELVLMQLRQFDSHNLTSVEKEMRQDKEKDDLTTLGKYSHNVTSVEKEMRQDKEKDDLTTLGKFRPLYLPVQSQPDLCREGDETRQGERRPHNSRHNLTSVEKEMRQDKEKDDLTTLGGESLLRPEVENLLPWLKKCLGGKVHAVKVTRRLDSHPCVITVEDMGAARHFLRMQSHQLTEENRYALLQPQLEINPSHPIIKKLSKLVTSNPRLAELVSQQEVALLVSHSLLMSSDRMKPRSWDWALLANAMVSAGLVEDPRTLVTSLNELLSMALEAH
uniref:Heat shock protein 75 kDa, mitochondrial n=1 Tax=Timema monikensis TaxID=170555 RepID=A0A7R9E4W5_9NEOP|nr:unnamed protein product [Timema monikensis]